MANNKEISQLPIAVTLDGTELVPVVQGGITKQATIQDLIEVYSDYTETFTYTGSPFTLAIAPSFIYSIRTSSLTLDENDTNDVIISGTSITVINPSFGTGDKLYIKYKA